MGSSGEFFSMFSARINVNSVWLVSQRSLTEHIAHKSACHAGFLEVFCGINRPEMRLVSMNTKQTASKWCVLRGRQDEHLTFLDMRGGQ